LIRDLQFGFYLGIHDLACVDSNVQKSAIEAPEGKIEFGVIPQGIHEGTDGNYRKGEKDDFWPV
jgi:hypothetical protein